VIAACQLNAETLTLTTRFGLDLQQTLDLERHYRHQRAPKD